MLLMQGDWWEKVRYFKPHEWGAWQHVEAELIFAVDELRHMAGSPCLINIDSRGVPVTYATSGHSPGSAHYRGLAVDLHFPKLHVVDQFLLAEKLGMFAGIGVYPKGVWNNPGLHLDIAEKGRRWARNADGKYVPLNWEFLKTLK